MSRTLFAVPGLAAACAGVGVFVLIGVRVWYLKAEVDRQAAYLVARADAAGDAADHAIGFVQEVLDRAGQDLEHTRRKTPEVAQEPVNPFLMLSARQAAQKLAGSVERVHGAMVAASDAVTIADAALDVAGGSDELKTLFGVSPDQLHSTRTALGSVSAELQQAKTVLGFPVVDASAMSHEQLAAVDGALERTRKFTKDMATVVGTARQRVADLKAQVDLWGWRAAVGVTAVAVLGAVGQLFMGRFFWRLLRRLPA